MSQDPPEVAAARIEAERSRARLMSTARTLQERLSPGRLASDTWEGAKIKGADLAEDAVDAVRRRPGVAGGIVAAITVFLAREPLMDLGRKAKNGMSGKRKAKRVRKTEVTETETINERV